LLLEGVGLEIERGFGNGGGVSESEYVEKTGLIDVLIHFWSLNEKGKENN